MYHIQQQSLFSFDELMKMSAESKYSVVLEELPMSRILLAINKRSPLGRPERLNVRAMIYALFIGKMEHIRFTKDLIYRLRKDVEFRACCRFTDSEPIPSEASFSRLITKLERTNILAEIQDFIVDQAITEGFLSGETLALDSSHIEAFERNPNLDKPKAEKAESSTVEWEASALLIEESCRSLENIKPLKPKRAKRGRVPKAEQEAWRQQMEAYEASLSLFEREIANMLPASYDELIADLPQWASVGAKGDHRGKRHTKFWYGYKVNLLVDTASQYIVTSVNCSGHVSDQRPAIVLLKRLKERFPSLQVKHILADKGYDGEPVYKQIRDVGAFGLIPLIHRCELPAGMDKHFRPQCQQGHSYRYDSYDAKRDTIKWTLPKECASCPFQGQGCQKVVKKKMAENVRKYTAPGRGSAKFAELFKQRTAVERVFAYLKLYFEMGSSRKRKKRALVDLDLSCLVYNVCKLGLDRLNQNIRAAKKQAV
ncbi:transposase [Paenibacillus oenotherae]|uniref:Transposase n=1 Tax=Paenibacillus oenotherae TaxID=1435645 RepID=A0ABS7D7X3_9BACL|nr:transposase [Paenibacillus oenotherae]MBW7475981.1 transposase [Paenibacillus oenotherae]